MMPSANVIIPIKPRDMVAPLAALSKREFTMFWKTYVSPPMSLTIATRNVMKKKETQM